MTCRSVLVLGGARSGKSRYAQQLAERCGGTRIFIATAEAWDDEMRARIAQHRADRDARWRTVEAPMDLYGALRKAANDGGVILVDCLTLWLSNLLLSGSDCDAEAQRLSASIPSLPGKVVFVSNEVGSGIVPENALSRQFRDSQGRLNQSIAAACNAVIFVAAGLPMQLKPAAEPTLESWAGASIKA